jgi:hypothetical protein
MKRLLNTALPLVALAFASRASAFCPSYSPDSTQNQNGCGVASQSGTNPTTAEWGAIFDLVSQGPTAWGSQGPAVADIGQGCGHPQPHQTVPARFPCELLKAIAMAESGWTQFCVPTEPSDEVGGASRTIISFDCGYGVSQVTSGMHTGETADFDRDRVAGDPTYNAAAGTQILAEKWAATACVGDNQPAIIEDWYIATWAYNGLAYSNNPNNPNYDSNRGVWDPAVGGAAPYQEKVFGRIEHTQGAWPPTALAYPNPGDCGSGGDPGALPEPSCASPTDCTDHRSVHTSSCLGDAGTNEEAGLRADASDDAKPSPAPDAGADSGGKVDSGEEAGSAAEGGKRQAPTKQEGAHGCACRLTHAPAGGGGTAAVVAAVLAALARRRRG